MKTLILGRPIHSHLSERIVGLGNGVVKKFGKHELEAHTHLGQGAGGDQWRASGRAGCKTLRSKTQKKLS